MSGFGSSPFGISPFGAGATAFDLLSAVAYDYHAVDLTFSSDLDGITVPATVSSGSYTITLGVSVLAVVQTGLQTVRLYTTPLNPGSTYVVTVTPTLVDVYGTTIGNRTASFSGVATPAKYVVEDLEASTVCTGLATYLSWTNPDDALRTKIVRRLRAWPFDLTDDHDVVYDGAPIEEFIDTGIVVPITALTIAAAEEATSITVASVAGYVVGDEIRVEATAGEPIYDLVTITGLPGGGVIQFTPALSNAYAITTTRVAKSTRLQAQTFYYYLVLVSDEAVPTEYDISDDSQTYALSIGVLNSKEWLWRHTPRHYAYKDRTPVAEGGGGGKLEKWYTVMGCWLDLMRGHFKALELLGDPDNAPFHVLPAMNLSLGIEPEGLSYDYDIVRRPLTSLIHVYKRKGTCPGIVETVRMFTKWDATCVEFGFNECQSGSGSLKTYDGESLLDYGQGPAPQITMRVIDAEGTGEITDTAEAWSVDIWGEGTIWGWLGDIACISSNTATVLTTKPPQRVASLRNTAAPGSTSFDVDATSAFVPGMTIQLIANVEAPAGQFRSEILEVLAVPVPGTTGTITTKTASVYNYPTGSKVTIGKSIIRSEYVGTGVVAGSVVTDATGDWVENQWTGFKLVGTDNVERTVVSNTADTITVTPGGPPNGEYALAVAFTLGGSYAARIPHYKYKVGNKTHSFLFEPLFDIETRGSLWDPYSRLYNGPGVNVNGVFGPGDIGVYVLGNVPEHLGRATSVFGAVFMIDPTVAAPGVNDLVGMYLNPNQNQELMFEIVANDATTITVAGTIDSLVVPGQAYYVLKPRDRSRFQRLSARLKKEFVDSDVRPHILFL